MRTLIFLSLAVSSILAYGTHIKGQGNVAISGSHSNVNVYVKKTLNTDHPQDHRFPRFIMSLPAEGMLLERPDLINQINEKLKNNSNVPKITVVALVGMGGVGKTNIARQFGLLQDSVVWEINAKNKELLLSSLQDLTYALARTDELREELAFIQQIQEPELKRKQLLIFIENGLREHPGWLLIYDNVEELEDIKNYLPYDAKAWGEGRVIITTRNSNIKNTGYVDPEHTIEIGELKPQESLSLLSKILYECEPYKLSKDKKEKALNFLHQIPAFPLDVSTAAYYIKDTHVSYDAYVKSVRRFSKTYDDIQERLLKEVREYTKTRFGIITLSFKKLIDTHPTFKELLFFMTLLDTNYIPRNLLELYKDRPTVSTFIRDLRKYSLITSEEYIENSEVISTFSFHQRNQYLGRAFFLEQLTEKEKEILLERIINSLKSYYEFCLTKNYKGNILLIPHLENLVQNLDEINLSQKSREKYKQNLFYMLGYIYYKHLSNLILAKHYFSRIFQMISQQKYISNQVLAVMLKDLGGVCAHSNSFDEGLFYANESIKLSKDLPNHNILEAENLCEMGCVYYRQGNFKKSKYYYEAALTKLLPVDFSLKKDLEARIYAALATLYGNNYINRQEANVAIKYLNKSLEILNASHQLHSSKEIKKGISCQVARNKSQLGSIYRRLGKYQEAVTLGLRDAEYIIKNDLDGCSHNMLRAKVNRGFGEVLLREGKLGESEDLLSKAINEFERLTDSMGTFGARTFRAEARIRLDKLDQAYEDCKFVFKTKQCPDNYSNLLYLTTIYHAAIIKYKQCNFAKAIEYFADFTKGMDEFCKGFLDKKTYQELERRDVFKDISHEHYRDKKKIKKYLKNSVAIFTAIYGSSHPFVKDYVVLNQNRYKRLVKICRELCHINT